MTEFVRLLAGAPRLPLGAHRRDEQLDLDDIARRPGLPPFVDLGLPDPDDVDCADFRLPSIGWGIMRLNL